MSMSKCHPWLGCGCRRTSCGTWSCPSTLGSRMKSSGLHGERSCPRNCTHLCPGLQETELGPRVQHSCGQDLSPQLLRSKNSPFPCVFCQLQFSVVPQDISHDSRTCHCCVCGPKCSRVQHLQARVPEACVNGPSAETSTRGAPEETLYLQWCLVRLWHPGLTVVSLDVSSLLLRGS